MNNIENYIRLMKNRKYFSQAGQDLFALEMLDNKLNGFYCEVGGSHPIESNNTFLLESNYNWSGVSLEFQTDLKDYFNLHRQNNCIETDAITFDYYNYFQENSFPNQIDYLSLDIEPAENTYKALLQIPFNKYRFSVITYEHDRYCSGENYMQLSRKYLESLGYLLVVSNVKIFGKDFEDWYVDPNIVSSEIWNKYKSENIEFEDIFKHF